MYEVSDPLPKEMEFYLHEIFIYSQHKMRGREQRVPFFVMIHEFQ